MKTALSDEVVVTFKGGVVASWKVVSRLLDLESRGARFELLPDGRFKVVPPSVLSPEDCAFLKAHRDEARRALQYQADDSHLYIDVV